MHTFRCGSIRRAMGCGIMGAVLLAWGTSPATADLLNHEIDSESRSSVRASANDQTLESALVGGTTPKGHWSVVIQQSDFDTDAESPNNDIIVWVRHLESPKRFHAPHTDPGPHLIGAFEDVAPGFGGTQTILRRIVAHDSHFDTLRLHYTCVDVPDGCNILILARHRTSEGPGTNDDLPTAPFVVPGTVPTPAMEDEWLKDTALELPVLSTWSSVVLVVALVSGAVFAARRKPSMN